MPNSNFTDESSASIIAAGGSSGSFEVGSSTPSGSSCRATVDGTDLVASGYIAPGRVNAGANDRVTGIIAGLPHNTTVGVGTTKTSEYAIAFCSIYDPDHIFNPDYNPTAVESQSVGTIYISNYDGYPGGSGFDWDVYYSFL